MLMFTALTPVSVDAQEQKTSNKDSTIVSVQFTPAHLFVNDNRTAGDMASIIEGNTQSNLQIATAINKVANIYEKNEREGRCASNMDRITQKTGFSVNKVEKILHKKRVFDMVSYTAFILYLLYFWYALSTFNNYANALSIKEYTIKVISFSLLFVCLILLFKYGDNLINGKYYPLIESIINSS